MTRTVTRAVSEREAPSACWIWSLAYPLLSPGSPRSFSTWWTRPCSPRLSTRARGAFALAAPVYLKALVIVRG